MARIFLHKKTRHTAWLRPTAWRVEGGLLWAFWAIVRALPPAPASMLGGRLLRLLGPRLRKHGHTRRNLRLAFPALTEAELESVARGVWENFGATLAESPHMATIATGRSVEVHVAPASRRIIDDAAPAIYAIPHLGHWELPLHVLGHRGVPVTTIYSPQSNPFLDRMIQSVRVAPHSRIVPKQNALRQLARDLRARRSVALLPDQRVDGGEPIPFFGHPAPTTVSPAWLALRFQRPLIPVEVERLGPARFRVTFHAPLPSEDLSHADKNQVTELTESLNSLFEGWIRQRPQQWLCTKRRWPEETYRGLSQGTRPNI